MKEKSQQQKIWPANTKTAKYCFWFHMCKLMFHNVYNIYIIKTTANIHFYLNAQFLKFSAVWTNSLKVRKMLQEFKDVFTFLRNMILTIMSNVFKHTVCFQLNYIYDTKFQMEGAFSIGYSSWNSQTPWEIRYQPIGGKKHSIINWTNERECKKNGLICKFEIQNNFQCLVKWTFSWL